MEYFCVPMECLLIRNVLAKQLLLVVPHVPHSLSSVSSRGPTHSCEGHVRVLNTFLLRVGQWLYSSLWLCMYIK